MQKFEYRVEQRSVGPGAHSWVAVDVNSGVEIPFSITAPARAGQYPEIQSYLKDEHNVEVILSYIAALDDLTIAPDGTSIWVFKRQKAEVVVHDIPRLAFEMTIGG